MDGQTGSQLPMFRSALVHEQRGCTFSKTLQHMLETGKLSSPSHVAQQHVAICNPHTHTHLVPCSLPLVTRLQG